MTVWICPRPGSHANAGARRVMFEGKQVGIFSTADGQCPVCAPYDRREEPVVIARGVSDSDAPPPVPWANALSPDELVLLDALGEIADGFARITGSGLTRDRDLAEVAALVHGLQSKVMGQAAARAYPSRFRLLGETLVR